MALTSAEIQQVLDAIAALGKKINQLPTATNLSGVTWLELLQDGVSKKVAPSSIAGAGTFTLTPDVTAGTGSVDDFVFDYIKVGGKVVLTFLCRSYVISVGEDSTTVELDLTGTAAEPAANFASGFLYTGSVNPGGYNASSGAIVVSGNTIATVSASKKIQVDLATEANVTGSDFNTIVGGTITITI